MSILKNKYSMANNTVINRCRKSDFKAFERMDDNIYKLRWGYKEEVERISVHNEETGEIEFTGEVKGTDWCTFESILYRNILTPYLLDLNILSKAQRYPSVSELHEIYEGLGVSQEKQVVLLKEKLAAEIRRYDKSEAVEDFSVGGVHMWLDSNKRTKVWENLMTAQQKGEENVTLRDGGLAFPMTVAMGWQLYYSVLDYARTTWNVTEAHLTAVNGLNTAEEILAYDYTSGYPEKLSF